MIVALTGTSVHAEIASKAGTRGAQFLRIEPGPRHSAMGGSFAAYGEDGFSLWGQPAAAALAEKTTLSVQHTEYILGISHEFVGAVYPVSKSGVFGVTLSYLNTGALDRATEDGAGEFVAQSGTFRADDLALGVNYARRVTESLSIGILGKYIKSTIDTIDATAVALDAGVRYQVTNGFSVGASIVNVGTDLSYLSGSDELPMTYRLGGAYRFDLPRGRSVLLAGDAFRGPDTDWEFGGGAEARLFPAIALRTGYRTDNAAIGSGLTGGLGIDFAIGTAFVDLDYSYTPYDDIGEAHRVAVNLKWSAPPLP